MVWRGGGGGYPKFNGSHFCLPSSSIHKMTGLGGKMVWTLTNAHRPQSVWLLSHTRHKAADYQFYLFMHYIHTDRGEGRQQHWSVVLTELGSTSWKTHTPQWEGMYMINSLVQWNWFSVVTGCTWVTGISDVREPISLHQAVCACWQHKLNSAQLPMSLCQIFSTLKTCKTRDLMWNIGPTTKI